MEKGQILEIKIDDMSSEGQGIGRADDGFVVFVHRTFETSLIYEPTVLHRPPVKLVR